MTFLRKLFQQSHRHKFRLADLKSRDADGLVSCKCVECGKVEKADYGLALNGTWVPIFIALALGLTGCTACNGLIFHPLHVLREQHKYNEASAVAPKDYQRQLIEEQASAEYMRTNAISVRMRSTPKPEFPTSK